MQKQRPVNLNLLTIRFPVTAISSILHRISGVILLFFIFFLLWALNASLLSAADFAAVKTCLSHPLCKFLCWIFLASLFFHFLAGIRHMIMDLGFAEGKKSSRYGSYAIIVLSIIFSILLGISLW